jgi:hypothetical protein
MTRTLTNMINIMAKQLNDEYSVDLLQGSFFVYSNNDTYECTIQQPTDKMEKGVYQNEYIRAEKLNYLLSEKQPNMCIIPYDNNPLLNYILSHVIPVFKGQCIEKSDYAILAPRK